MTRMPFGKFKGSPLCEVPLSYLHWCLKHCGGLWPDLRAEIEEQVRSHTATVNPFPPAVLPSWTTWPEPTTPTEAWSIIDRIGQRLLASLFHVRQAALIDPAAADHLFTGFRQLEQQLNTFRELTASRKLRRFDYESLLQDAAMVDRQTERIAGGTA